MEQSYEGIDLIDLLKYILDKWKIVVVGMLVCAILAGIYAVVISKQTPDTEKEISALKEVMTEEEINAVEDAANIINTYRTKFNTQKEYTENSIYQNLDPYAINTVTLSYFINVSSQDKDKILPILQTYSLALKSEDLYEQFAKEIGSDLNPLYYQELVNVTYTTGNTSNSNSDNSNSGTGMLNVVVYGESEDSLSKLVEFVKSALDAKVASAIEVYGAHSFTLSSETKSVTINAEMATKQQENLTNLTTISTAISNTENKFDGNQLTYLKYLIHEELEEETSVVKYVVIGLLLGAVLVSGCYVLVYLISGTVKTEEEICEITGSTVIGTTSDEMGLLATKINYFANKTDSKKIALISFKNDSELFDKLKSSVKDIELDFVFEPKYNSEEYSKLIDVNSAILFEKLKNSKSKMIIDNVDLCRETDTQVLGVILDK